MLSILSKAKRVSLIAVTVVVLLLFFFYEDTELVAVEEAVDLPVVSVVSVTPQELPMQVTVSSQLRPKNSSDLVSLVEGKVVWVNPVYQNGQFVKQNEILLRLDSTELEAQLEQAKLALKQAQLNLLEEQREAKQAAYEWKLGSDALPENPLVFRKPHLALAKQAVQAAKSELKRAELQLSYTEIRSPYEGEISSRAAAIGDWIESGQTIGHLQSVNHLEMNVQLSEGQWQQLGADNKATGQKLEGWILDAEGHRSTQLTLQHASKKLTPETQLRSIYFEVEGSDSSSNPSAWQWVEIDIVGKTLKNLFEVPANALTRDSSLWLVDDNHQLRRKTANVLFYRNAIAVVKVNDFLDEPMLIAKHPQAHFIEGRSVDINGSEALQK